MSNKPVLLICGATGFIGRNLTESLAASGKFDVVATHFQRKPFTTTGVRWIRADLRSATDVERAVKGTDIIVHAAATTSGARDIINTPYLHVTDNAVMNSLLFRAAHIHGVRHVVFLSCTVMYAPSETPLREEDFNPADEIHPKYYGVGWTKVYSEKMCEFYSRLGKTRFTVARHSNVYGPYDKFDLERSHVFGATVTKVLGASNGKVVVWGEGTEARDLIHVDDLVSFVQSAIAKQTSPMEIFNVGRGEAIAIRDLVANVIKASGRDLRIEFDRSQPTIPTRLAINCDKAQRLLSWKPKVSLEEGILRTLEWARKHRTAETA